MKYIELNIDFKVLEPWREIVISNLADKGAESFIETKTGCKAYFPEKQFTSISNLNLKDFNTYIDNINIVTIEDQNWNATWESNFEPVFVGDELAILAPFHDQNTKHQIKVLIQPQMSFGTGHHQTTWLMSQRLLQLNLEAKQILDMGTGTGVLAILAEKLGAANVFAPDIDEWAYKNAIDNCKLNDCKNIKWALGGAELLEEQKFDILIANINKNILFQQFSAYAKASNPEARLLISGFFSTDIDSLISEAKKSGFIFENKYCKDEWALIEFIKN